MRRVAIVEENGHLTALPTLSEFLQREFVIEDMSVVVAEVEDDLAWKIWACRHNTFVRPNAAAELVVRLDFDGQKMRLLGV